MKVYIAGKITNDPNFKEKFHKKEIELISQGHSVMNPAILPKGFAYEDYMEVCFAMIDTCDVVCLLADWQESNGASRERLYAWAHNKPTHVEIIPNKEDTK